MKKLGIFLVTIMMLFGLMACGLFSREEIVEISVEPSEQNFFLETFDISTLELIVLMNDDSEVRLPVEESMVSLDDLAKLSVQGEHIITIEYEGFTTSFSVIVHDYLLVEQFKFIHQLQESSLSFEAWFNEAKANYKVIDFNEANMVINLWGEVFLEDSQNSVSMGPIFLEFEEAFNNYVQSSYFNNSNELMIVISETLHLNFGHLKADWMNSQESPYSEYQSRFKNYHRDEEAFIEDILFSRLFKDDRYNIHFPSDTYLLVETLLEENEAYDRVVFAGVLTAKFNNGFLLTDGDHSIMIYTFGQSGYNNLEKGMLVRVEGSLIERDIIQYIRPTNHEVYLENQSFDLSVSEKSLRDLYDLDLFDLFTYNETVRLSGGLSRIDGDFYIIDDGLSVKITWLSAKDREMLINYLGKWVEIDVVLFDFSEGILEVLFTGEETKILDTEDTRYELMYEVRDLLARDFTTYGYYGKPIELIEQGVNGTIFSYQSLHPEAMTNKGEILDPHSENQVFVLEVTAQLGDETYVFEIPIIVEALSVRMVFSLQYNEGYNLVEGLVYYLEHHEDEGVYWVILYDRTGFVRMRISDDYEIKVNDNVRVFGVFEHEFNGRGQLLDIEYVGEAEETYQRPSEMILTVDEYLSTPRYRGMVLNSGMPVYLTGFIVQEGTAYYLYDENYQHRVRLFSENSIAWSEYQDMYVKVMMFIDNLHPVRTLTTLQARDLVEVLGEEHLAINQDWTTLQSEEIEAFSGQFELPSQGENGTTFKWESLMPELVDNQGHILTTVDFFTAVPFKVTLQNGEAVREVTFEVLILAITAIENLGNHHRFNEVMIEGVIYHIDEYTYVYITDNTGKLQLYPMMADFNAYQEGDTIRIRGGISYNSNVKQYVINRIHSIEAIDKVFEIPEILGPITAHNIIESGIDNYTLVRLQGYLNVDSSVYMYDHVTEKKIFIYPGFYTEPYEIYNGKLVEIDAIIYRRGDNYEIRQVDLEEGIRVIDEALLILDYDVLYLNKKTFQTILSDIDLPSSGPLGTEYLEWVSTNLSIFNHDGSLVNLPSQNTTVEFTAKAVFEGVEVDISIDVKLIVEPMKIESIVGFSSYKEVLIEGVIYNKVHDYGEYIYMLYDNTGPAIIVLEEDVFEIGDVVSISGYAHNYEGWIVFDLIEIYDFKYEIISGENYEMPYIGEVEFEDFYTTLPPVGSVVRIEGFISDIRHGSIVLEDQEGEFKVRVYYGGSHGFTQEDLNTLIAIDLVIVDYTEPFIIFHGFLYLDGNIEIIE